MQVICDCILYETNGGVCTCLNINLVKSEEPKGLEGEEDLGLDNQPEERNPFGSITDIHDDFIH